VFDPFWLFLVSLMFVSRSKQEQAGASRSKQEQAGASRSKQEQAGASKSKQERAGARLLLKSKCPIWSEMKWEKNPD
jgi:hypothetical protein